MLHTIFAAHPNAHGESYTQHQRAAFFYAGALLTAGLAAALHGLVPCLCKTTASRTIARLHASMAARQAQAAPHAPAPLAAPAWQSPFA